MLQGPRLIYHGVVTMPARRTPEAIRRNTRVLIAQLFSDFRPAILMLEENSFGRGRRAPGLHAVVSEAKKSGCREGVKVLTRTASAVKKAVTGSGRASKEEVARAVARQYPELRAYLRQTAKWRARYHGNMFDAVALGLATGRKQATSKNPLPPLTRQWSTGSGSRSRLPRCRRMRRAGPEAVPPNLAVTDSLPFGCAQRRDQSARE